MAQQEFGPAASPKLCSAAQPLPEFGLAASQSPASAAQPLPEAPAMAARRWAAGRGPHPAPHESEWVVEHVDSSGWEVWFCNLCRKEVTPDNGHVGSQGHENKVLWATQGRRTAQPPPTQAAPRSFAPEAPAPKASAATAGAWLSAESGAAAAASSSASASSPVVVNVAAAQGGTITIELPVAVAFELKDALDRALAGRRRQ